MLVLLLVELSLGACTISGTIPSQLGSLSRLGTILLFCHSASRCMDGSILTCLSSTLRSENLFIYRNSLSGTIPSELGSLSALGILRFVLDLLLCSAFTQSNLMLSLWGNDLSGTIPSQLGVSPVLGKIVFSSIFFMFSLL